MALRRDLYVACQIMAREDLVQAFGHFSARIPGTDQVLISPMMGLHAMAPGDIVTVDLDGNQVAGDAQAPMETHLHLALYRRRKDVLAVARTHSTMAITFGSLGIPVRPVHNFGCVFPNGVPVFNRLLPNLNLVTTPKYGDAVARALGKENAILLRGNGTAVVGRSVAEACVRALLLEEAAALQYRCLAVGRPRYYTKQEAAACERMWVIALEEQRDRVWDYYRRKHGL